MDQELELHNRVFNVEEQKKIADCVYQFQHIEHNGKLRASGMVKNHRLCQKMKNYCMLFFIHFVYVFLIPILTALTARTYLNMY